MGIHVLSLEQVLDETGIEISEIAINQIHTCPRVASGCLPSVSVLRHRFVNSDGNVRRA